MRKKTRLIENEVELTLLFHRREEKDQGEGLLWVRHEEEMNCGCCACALRYRLVMGDKKEGGVVQVSICPYVCVKLYILHKYKALNTR